MAVARTPYLENVKTLTIAATGSTYLTPYDSGLVFVNNSTTCSVMLPAVASCNGVRYQFVKTSNNTHAITIDANASETINNATTYASMDARYDCAEIVSNGSEWVVVDAKIA